MRTLRTWALRALGHCRRRQLGQRLDEELRFHLEMQARDLAARGMGAEEARRAARLALAPGGSTEPLRQAVRAQGGLPALETLGQDLRYALRMLRKSPGFTAVALLSLALGVGTNCAIFSVVDALLLKTLPVAGAERLVVFARVDGGARNRLFSYPAWRLLQQAAPVCSGVMAVTNEFTAVVRPLAPTPSTAPETPQTPQTAAMETAQAELVSGNFFSLLGVGMAAGRAYTAAEDTVPGGHPLAVISYGYWQRRFGRDPRVIGQAIAVNGLPVTVIGVARNGFHGPFAEAAPDLFLPVTLREAAKYQGGMDTDGPEMPGRPIWEQVNDSWLELLAQRRQGVSVAQASAALNVLFQRDKEARLTTRTEANDRQELQAETLAIEPAARGLSRLRLTLTQPLLILMAVAGLVLLIACANLASLLLARADRRHKEMALRLGIGAGRGRLLRQLLTESLLLAGLGAVLGVACAGWGSRLLLGLVSRNADPIPLDVALDWRMLAFALGVALATGIGFGLAPALQATRVDLAASMKEGAGAIGAAGGAGGGGGRGRGGRLGWVLVAAQIGLSLLLLIGAGLFVRSLQNLMAVDTGFARDGVALVTMNPRLLGADDARLTALYPRLVERLEAVPGVRSASLASFRLLSGSSWEENIALPGYAPRPGEDMDVQLRVVTPHYFATLSLPLAAGRAFTARDRQGAPRVAIVDQAMARRFWPREARAGAAALLGRRFGFGPATSSRDLEIVGVARDARSIRLGDAPPPTAYLPVAQRLAPLFELEVRTAGGAGPPPPGLAAALRRAIAEVDPNLPVFSILGIDEQLARSLARERAVARLIGFFGLLALGLAAIGLYGVMSYSVARRTSEIGLRMALGASRGQVLGLVMRETARLTAAGVAAGLIAAAATTRLAASQLFGLSAWDPATLAAATLAMVAVALAAGFLPARRAADTYPMAALRRD
ncbi:MAG TPA: ABC transporter permease [Thermoanaerobaculia bacterium]|nr:ABC transporter permease [Thermoanaerobaculia bacterium]